MSPRQAPPPGLLLLVRPTDTPKTRPPPARAMILDTPLDITQVADTLHDGLYATDRDRRIVYWNRAAERITGFTAAEVMGRCCADNVLMHVDAEGRSLCLGGCPLSATMQDGRPREVHVMLHHKLGHRVPVIVRAQPIVAPGGIVVGAIEVFADHTSHEVVSARIEHLEALALIDPLTQVANRRYLASELASHLAMQQRTGMPFGVAFFDIDGFKRFNDQHGHEAGDQALQTVARTMTAAIRPHDIVGRWGGEEFLAILTDVDAGALRTLAERLCRLVGSSRVHVGDTALALTVSGGATLATPDDTPATLVDRADALMYATKRAGGNGIST